MPCSEELEAVLTKECCNLGLGFCALWPVQACEGCTGTLVHTHSGGGGHQFGSPLNSKKQEGLPSFSG